MRQLELTERILRLRGVPVFASMTSADLAQLAGAMRTRTFEKGDVLLREDEPPHSFYLLGTGRVTMRRKGKRIGTVRAPGGVGFLSFMARTAGSTEAVAESYSEAFEVPADAMDEVFEDHFSVLLSMIRWVGERLLNENRAQHPPPYVPPDPPFVHLIGDRELGIVERIYLVRRARAFAQANVNSIARLVRQMQEVRVGADETLWRPGDKADFSLFIVKGMLELRWHEGKSVQVVGPGYVVGGAESIVGRPRWNVLVTREPVVALRGSREALIDMFEDDHEIAVRFLAMLANFLVTIWDRKAEVGITSVGAPPSEAMAAARPVDDVAPAASSP